MQIERREAVIAAVAVRMRADKRSHPSASLRCAHMLAIWLRAQEWLPVEALPELVAELAM